MLDNFLKKLFGETKETPEKEPPRKIHITKKGLCEILEVPFDGEDKEYTGLNYSRYVKPGNVSFLQRAMLSPFRPTPKSVSKTLAERSTAQGAELLITTSNIKGYPCLVVEPPIIDSLVKIVHEYWKEVKPLTLEVTGSYGKTTVVSMLESVLGTTHKVFGHNGDSLNMVVHTLMRVQEWDGSYDVFLQEAAEGIHPGVPEVISKMISPDICLVTNVGTSHMEYMGSQEAIFESCIGLQEGMSEEGVLVLNADDPFLLNAETKRKTVYYGMENDKADYRAENVKSTADGISFDIMHDGVRTPVTMSLVGAHNAQNAAGVFAVARAAGMDDEDIVKGLKVFRPSGYRQRMLRINKYDFYLDCYNASIESMKSALDSLSDMEIDKDGRKIAILSDIAQAGEFKEEYHREVGRYALESKADVLICHGENAELVAGVASANQDLEIHIMHSLEEIEEYIEKNTTPKDVILLKGSHSSKFYMIPDDLVGTWFKEEGKDAYELVEGKARYRVFPTAETGYLMKAVPETDSVKVLSKVDGSRLVIPGREVGELEIAGIGEEAFKESTISHIDLPDTIRNIRRRAFYKARALKAIELPESVMYIDDEAFAQCPKLREVKLTGNIKYISESAFNDNSKVTFICPKGSYADEYATRKGIKVRYE